MELDYSIKIPKEYWNKPVNEGRFVSDTYCGRKVVAYLPYGYDKTKVYNCCYFKMGTSNSAEQFWTYPGYISHFEYVIQNLIDRGEIEPTVVVSVQGNPPNQGWIQYHALGLVQFVESKISTYAKFDVTPGNLIATANHRAIGGWSLGSIETVRMLCNDQFNDYYKMFNFYDIQSGYNPTGMNKIDPKPFVGCVAGSNDDPNCVRFTNQCANYFATIPDLNKNKAQIVPGYTHMITYQLNYFFNAIKVFFPLTEKES